MTAFTLTYLKPDPVDLRDFRLNIPATAYDSLPTAASVKDYSGDIENQLQLSSCVANAAVSCFEILQTKSNTFNHLSRLFVYFNAREEYEALRGKDSGAYVVDGFKSVYNFGVPTETTWPYDPTQVLTKPSPLAFSEALTRKVNKYERVGQFTSTGGDSNSVGRIKAAIAMGYPVMIGMRLGGKFRNIVGPLLGHKVQYPDPVNTTDNPYIGNHAVCVVAYDDALDGFIIENSWGTVWGDGGFGLIKYSIIQVDCQDAWVCTAFAGVVYPPKLNFMPDIPMTVTPGSAPAIMYVDSQSPKFTAQIVGGSGVYDHWWYIQTPGAYCIQQRPTDNITNTEAWTTIQITPEFWTDVEQEKSITVCLRVTDHSTVPQVYTLNFKLVVSRANPNRINAAKMLINQIVALLTAGQESQARALYNTRQQFVEYSGFSDAEFSKQLKDGFGITIAPESIAQWKIL